MFARQLQQAIGGIEGEIRVCMQYFFQAWGARGPTNKYRDMLLHTATEEIGHIEMLATAVALNLENAPGHAAGDRRAAESVVSAVMGGGERPRHMVEGMLQQHLLSTGMAAFPGNSDGVPFDCRISTPAATSRPTCSATSPPKRPAASWRCGSTTPRTMTGMQDMLSFLIARDTMHQQQWLAVIEELGGAAALPIPNSFDQSQEKQEFSYIFLATDRGRLAAAAGRWTEGPSLDGKGTFTARQNEPLGEEPVLGPARPDSGAQREQMQGR